MNLGTPELLVILVIVMLLFGAKRIPDLMKGFGQGIKSFKDGMRDETQTTQASTPAPTVTTVPPITEKK